MATQEAVAADALSTIHRYIDAFNKGDVQDMAAAFAIPGSILDGMPPHVWHGATAAAPGCLHYDKERRRIGFFRAVGRPLHMDVTGDAAYVVVPATMKFKVHGKTDNAVGCSVYRAEAWQRLAHRVGLGERYSPAIDLTNVVT
jgi:hypothetical protein